MDLVLLEMVHLSREQVLPSPWPGIAFGSPASLDPVERKLLSLLVSVQLTTILWRSEKLCFAEICGSFMLQTVDHLKFNQV